MARPSFVYLASQSPRRQQLLQQIGVSYELLLPQAQEDAEALEEVLPNEPPARYVRRVTQNKLEAALLRLQRLRKPIAPILCADTTVALGRQILGKPHDAGEARAMLRALSGQEHRVLTAVALATPRQQRLVVQTSWVRFAPWSAAQIQQYVRSGEPMGKAGAYAIQGWASTQVAAMRGSYSGIMGLPLHETAQLLREFGIPV